MTHHEKQRPLLSPHIGTAPLISPVIFINLKRSCSFTKVVIDSWSFCFSCHVLLMNVTCQRKETWSISFSLFTFFLDETCCNASKSENELSKISQRSTNTGDLCFSATLIVESSCIDSNYLGLQTAEAEREAIWACQYTPRMLSVCSATGRGESVTLIALKNQ